MAVGRCGRRCSRSRSPGQGVGQDGVVGDPALAGHHALRHRPAVEEDALVRVVAVVVVPVQAGGRPARAGDSACMATALPTSTSQAAGMPRSFISLSSTQGETPSCFCISIQQRMANASRPNSSTSSSRTTPSRRGSPMPASGHAAPVGVAAAASRPWPGRASLAGVQLAHPRRTRRRDPASPW